MTVPPDVDSISRAFRLDLQSPAGRRRCIRNGRFWVTTRDGPWMKCPKKDDSAPTSARFDRPAARAPEGRVKAAAAPPVTVAGKSSPALAIGGDGVPP